MRHSLPRRALVLSHDGARHPFRQTLPPHVFVVVADPERPRSFAQTFREDWRSVLTTFCSAFVAVSLFVA